MAKRKAEVIVERPPEDFLIDKKIISVGQSKRAPIISGPKAKEFYETLKALKVKLTLDQAISMPQYKDGKEPLARFVLVQDFRVIIDLTE